MDETVAAVRGSSYSYEFDARKRRREPPCSGRTRSGYDSAGEGIPREDIGRCLWFLAEIKFMQYPTGRGRELHAILVDIVQAQSQWGSGRSRGAFLRPDRDSDVIGIFKTWIDHTRKID